MAVPPGRNLCARFLRLAGVKHPTPTLRGEVSAFRHDHRTRQVELLSRQLGVEKRLAVLVEDAYGLTAGERSLLPRRGLCVIRLMFWRRRSWERARKAILAWPMNERPV